MDLVCALEEEFRRAVLLEFVEEFVWRDGQAVELVGPFAVQAQAFTRSAEDLDIGETLEYLCHQLRRAGRLCQQMFEIVEDQQGGLL